MSEVQLVADGWRAFTEDNAIGSKVPAFELLYGGHKIYAFQEKFIDMKDVNSRKYSIAVNGGAGAVLNYTENEPHWETFEFAPFNSTSNTIETFFTHEDVIYALITSLIGETKLQDIFKFNEESREFEKLEFEASEAITEEEGTDSYVTIAENSTEESTRIVVVTNGGSFHIFSIDMADTSIKTATHIGDIKSDGYPIHKAVAAFRHGENLYISYGVIGCGFIWERSRIIKYNLETKEHSNVAVTGDMPSFSFGPKSSWCSGFLWGFCTGASRKGMHQSQFNGTSWVMYGLENDEPRWEKKEAEFDSEDEGLITADNLRKATILVSKDKTTVIYHDQTNQ